MIVIPWLLQHPSGREACQRARADEDAYFRDYARTSDQIALRMFEWQFQPFFLLEAFLSSVVFIKLPFSAMFWLWFATKPPLKRWFWGMCESILSNELSTNRYICHVWYWNPLRGILNQITKDQAWFWIQSLCTHIFNTWVAFSWHIQSAKWSRPATQCRHSCDLHSGSCIM